MKLAVLLLLAAAQAHAANPVKPCVSNQLSLATDGENGSFNGMSHSGTLLVLRNIGPTTCSVQPFPNLTFKDVQGKPLDISSTVQGSRYMHPGPVVRPPVIAPAAELTSMLRWVSGDVYDHGACAQPASVTIRIGSETQTVALDVTICGEPKPTYTMTRFVPDPTYKPAP